MTLFSLIVALLIEHLRPISTERFVEAPLKAFAHFDRMSVILVGIPLMIISGIATHMNSRASVARQSPEAANNPQTALMNKLALYVFPLGVVVGGLVARHAERDRADGLLVLAVIGLALFARLPVGLAGEGEGERHRRDAVLEVRIDLEEVASGAEDIGLESLLGIARIDLFDDVAALVHQRELDAGPGDVFQRDVEPGGGVGFGDVEGVEIGAGIAVGVGNRRDLGVCRYRDGLGAFGGVVDRRGVLAAGGRDRQTGRRQENRRAPHKHENRPQDRSDRVSTGA